MFNLTELTVDMSDYFVKWLDYFCCFPEKYRETKNTCLSSDCFATKNLLEYIGDQEFLKNINHIKDVCQGIVGVPLDYFYLHMINYKNGGVMNLHKHDHNEDYSFVYYLNTCNDGETILYCDNPTLIKPEKNRLLLFSSDLYHSANYSNNKKILVGGLRTK